MPRKRNTPLEAMYNFLRSESPARKAVVEFSRIDGNQRLTWRVPGTQAEAEAFLQHVRVELSRMRRLLRNLGHAPGMVVMRKVAIVEVRDTDADGNQTIAHDVTVVKDTSERDTIELIRESLPDLAHDQMVSN